MQGSVVFRIVVAGVVCGGTLSAQRSQSVGTCYDVAFRDMVPGSEPVTFYEPLPARIELRTDSTISIRGSRWSFVTRSPDGPEGPAAFWRRDADTLRVWLPRGWSAGLDLAVAPSPVAADTLIGRVRDYTDYHPRTALQGTVVLIRRPCRAGADPRGAG